jgi:hypothetical protein
MRAGNEKRREIDFLPQWSQMKEKANYTLDFFARVAMTETVAVE